MLARHVADLIGPSSGASFTSCIRRFGMWYVVYYKMIHGPYNTKLKKSFLNFLNIGTLGIGSQDEIRISRHNYLP